MNTVSIVAPEHPVASVVVFKSSKAEVTRSFDVKLKRGRNRITISNLPTTTEKDSVRISVTKKESSHSSPRPQDETPLVYLSDIVCSLADSPSDDPIRRTIRALELKRSGLESEKRLLDTQAEVMVSYARSLTGQHASPTDIDGFLSAFGERGRENIDAVLKIQEQMAEIDDQIDEVLRKKRLMKGTLNTELVAVVVADGDMTVQFQLIYIVSNAVWSPNYRLHAVTGEDGRPSRGVALRYQASIRQATGEDWKDAPLTLSTVATDTLVKKIPGLEPAKVFTTYAAHTPPMPVMRYTRVSRSSSSSRSRSRSRSRARARSRSPRQLANRAQTPIESAATSFRVEPDFTSSRRHSAEADVIALSDDELSDGVPRTRGRRILPTPKVIQTPMTLTYTVRGNSDIPSDGKEHVVTIATLEFEADVEYITVPRLDPRVFLQCRVKNTSEYRLLPGPVSVVMDKSYVSRTSLPDVNRNETFDFTLGDDPSIIVLYDRSSIVTKEGTQTYADPLDITTYTSTITAYNTHRFAIENIIIRDAIPISTDNKRIKVILQKPQPLIGAGEGAFVLAEGSRGESEAGELVVKWEKEQDGLYEYKWRINAEDKIKVETVFDVKAPSDTKYTLSNFAIQGKMA